MLYQHLQTRAEGESCISDTLVYKAEVSTDKDDAKVYIGVTANTFKERFRNQTKSIKLKMNAMATKLNCQSTFGSSNARNARMT